MTQGEPSIACMVLYKDEREHLARIAPKILRVFDQAIFVTNLEGSSDGSEAYLDSLGVEPVRMQWVESFAAARQVGLDASTCDYTMWMDCDDDLVTDLGSWEAARAAVRAHLVKARREVHWHRVYHADRQTFWVRENWFHRDARVRVRYPTHEIYEWQGSIAAFPPGLLDRVNAPLRPDYKGKHWRSGDMLQRYLKDVDPGDCRCRYYLAAEFQGPQSAKAALYKDFFDALDARPTYRNFPEEWCALYGLFEARRHVPEEALRRRAQSLLMRWPFELLTHVLNAMITCELEPTIGNARRFLHVIENRDAYQRAGSGWFRGWYLDRSLNACGYYVHKVAVATDSPELAAAAVRVLEEARARSTIPEVRPVILGNLAMARRWKEGYFGPSDAPEDEDDSR